MRDGARAVWRRAAVDSGVARGRARGGTAFVGRVGARRTASRSRGAAL